MEENMHDFNILLDLMDDLENEDSFEGKYFIDLVLDNNSIICFYKTTQLKYLDSKNNNTSYLFPTTFRVVNGQILVNMVLGSVYGDFVVPENINGTFINSKHYMGSVQLKKFNVGYHSYQLLCIEGIGNLFDTKPYQCIMIDLYNIGFPFMRITNNGSMNVIEEKSNKNEEIRETTNDTKISFNDKFNSWYNDIKNKEIFKDKILSTFVKNYAKIIYDSVSDGMIAYLFETALYKGYACAEYFINEKKYNNRIDIEHTNELQSAIAMFKLNDLMGDSNDEDFMSDNIDDFFHNIIAEDEGSYEHVIAEEQRKEIVKSSKYYMTIGLLYRFTELNMRYGDFPDETDVSMITESDFPKLFEYIRK